MGGDLLTGKSVDPNTKEILHEKEHVDFEQRLSALEKIHPELKPQKPTPPLKTLLKWVFFIALVGIIVYSIYLYYLYDNGWAVNLPFIGILQK